MKNGNTQLDLIAPECGKISWILQELNGSCLVGVISQPQCSTEVEASLSRNNQEERQSIRGLTACNKLMPQVKTTSCRSGITVKSNMDYDVSCHYWDIYGITLGEDFLYISQMPKCEILYFFTPDNHTAEKRINIWSHRCQSGLEQDAHKSQ